MMTLSDRFDGVLGQMLLLGDIVAAYLVAARGLIRNFPSDRNSRGNNFSKSDAGC